MESKTIQQGQALLEKSNRLLCVLPEQGLTYDMVLSALGLQHFLHSLGKEVVIYTPGDLPKPIPSVNFDGITRKISPVAGPQVLTLDLGSYLLDHFIAENIDGKIQISIFGDGAHFTKDAVKIGQSPASVGFDLVMYVGVTSYEACPTLISSFGDSLYALPSIAVNNQMASEPFAAINIIDVTAVSLVQLVHSVSMPVPQSLPELTATAWLGALMAATGSFQSPRMSTAVFELAALFMEAGARHQDLAVTLFRTRSFKHLKLWGRLLARIEHDPGNNLLWSLLPSLDFSKSDTDPSHIADAALETLDHVSGFKVFLAGGQISTDQIRVVLAVSAGVSLKEVLLLFPDHTIVVEPWILRSAYQIVELTTELSLGDMQILIQEKIIPYVNK